MRYYWDFIWAVIAVVRVVLQWAVTNVHAWGQRWVNRARGGYNGPPPDAPYDQGQDRPTSPPPPVKR